MTTSWADTPNGHLLVDSAWLADHLGDPVVTRVGRWNLAGWPDGTLPAGGEHGAVCQPDELRDGVSLVGTDGQPDAGHDRHPSAALRIGQARAGKIL